MPLLGQKIYLAKAEENRAKKGKGKFEIPFTNEVFTSKEEYERQMQGYKQPIWTCQCTGFTGLTYEEALRSETEVHKRLSAKFPKHLEKSVLELVHHRGTALDLIVDEALQRIQSIFGVGETVELKVKVRGKIVRGKIVDAKQMCEDELPTSDKENSVSEDHPYSSPQHSKPNKSTSFQYNVQMEGEDKVIHSIPGKDLLHTGTLPSRDLLQLFIRASAVQAGSKPWSPWVVSEELVKKFDLPNQINEVTLSPYKVMPSSLGNLTSIKRSAEPHEMASRSKKRKLLENNSSSSGPKLKQSSLMDFGKKDNMVLSVVLQRDQNTSNIEWNGSELVTPTKRNPNIMSSPEKVHLDHSYSSPPPHQKHDAKTSPKSTKEKSTAKRTNKTEKKKEKKEPATKKAKSTANKKQSTKASKSKTHSKKSSKKKAGQEDSEDEDVVVIDDDKEDAKSSKSRKSGKTDSQEDDIIVVDDSPGRKHKSSEERGKSPKKKLPTKRKLTDHFKSVPGSSPGKSPRKSVKKGTESKEKGARKSPVKSKKTKPTKASKQEESSSEDEDGSSSSAAEFEDDKQKSKTASSKAKKQPAKKPVQKKTKQTPTKKSAKSKVSSQKGTPKRGTPKKETLKKETPKKGTPKKAVEDKSTPKRATPKKAQSKGTPSKSTPKKTATKKATPKKGTPKKAVTPKKGTSKKMPKKATPKKTPKKGTPAKKTPKKTPGGKKPFKQATLFDVGAKKGATKDGDMVTKASPKTPKSPRQPPIANKMCRIKKKDPDMYKKLVNKASKDLTEKQIQNLKPEIQEDVLLKYKERMERLKWQNMTPEEREKVRQAKKEEKKKKRQEERQKKSQELRKLREEQSKRYEDQDLTLKALPAPKLVSMPEGLPNTLFGDIAMVVEFLNCYSGLLMPDDPYPITADSLMKALVYGKEGFAYLARVLVILLKTLLQDEIAEDWREISMKLSDITVNMHTSSELLRMSLRRTDHEHVAAKDNDDQSSNFSDSSYEDDDDVPYALVEKLETCEFFDLEPTEKLELLVCVCHRILGSYSIQDFMEQKQRAAAKLWREKLSTLKEKNDRLREEKQKKKEEMEAKRLEMEKLKEEKAKENGQNSSDDKKAEKQVNGETKQKKPKKTTKKESKAESKEPEEEVLDLASVVKRRRLLTAQMKAEKAEQEKIDKERRLKEQEIYRKQREAELFQKSFEDGIQLAKLALRQQPVGTDRNHSRYWIFSTVTPGLFIEKGWADQDVGYSTDENAEDTKTGKQKVEHTIPKVGQNLWFQYTSVKEIDTLLDVLNNQGIRESALYTELKKRYEDITRMTFLSRRSGPDLRDSDGPKELLDSFREDMSDLELNIRQGQLGGVDNFDKWEKKLLAATKLKDMGALMIESFQGVNRKFLQGILAHPKAKPIELIKLDDGEDGDKDKSNETVTPQTSEKVIKWMEAVEASPILSRLHVLLAVFETCVKWEKSAANARCKICRKKDGDNQLLLCDECNQPFHLFCLRPALTSIPKGEWKCPACAPSERRATRGRVYYGSDDSMDRQESSDPGEIEHDEVCAVCEEDGELVQCYKCPSVYHRECHDPPLKNYPRGSWKCSECLNPGRSRRRKKANNGRQKRAATRGRKQESSDEESEESDSESESEEEDSEEEEEVKPRRGRGRPPKAAKTKKAKKRSKKDESDEEEDESDEEEDSEEEVKPRRGRGRPPARSAAKSRKRIKEEESDEDEEESDEEEEDSDEEEEEVKPRRGRGRPPARSAKKGTKKEESEEEEDDSDEEEEEDSDEEESEEEEESEDEEVQIKRGRGRSAAKPAAKAKKAAKKRAKKVVFDSEVAESIINKLMCYRGSVPFRVSPDASEAPDYEEMIKIPMDLHMVKNKCSSNDYESYEDFFADVKLIFTNAHSYYDESNYIRKQATKLEDYFINQIKWANADAVPIYQTLPEADVGSSASSTDGTDETDSTTDQKPSRKSSRRR